VVVVVVVVMVVVVVVVHHDGCRSDAGGAGADVAGTVAGRGVRWDGEDERGERDQGHDERKSLHSEASSVMGVR
jgi:hypothetical protein